MLRDTYTLGLDLGTNSIGWAIIRQDDTGQPSESELVACGSRIFQEVIDAKTRVPKNKARRDARFARRLTSRRKMRKGKLLNLLIERRLLPSDDTERQKIFTDNKSYEPYQLRKKHLMKDSHSMN